MSVIRNVVKNLVPAPAKPPVRRALLTLQWLSLYPFASPLAREIKYLEAKKNDRTIAELADFAELKDSAWYWLGTIAYQIVRSERPKVIVELGTHMGFSALAMGLALRDNKDGGRLFAVDTWQGDPQAGFYGDEVYNTFLARRDALGLQSTIEPLRMTFDEARDKVATPIDILHIDGLHTWDAVSHDWDTFSPLVRPGGLVFFHDVNSQWQDLGRYWGEISKKYESFMIPYSSGLGIVRMPAK